MTTINQKEYLKKYLSLGSEPGKKKKHKKKTTGISDRIKIIDDDIDGATFNEAVEEDLLGQNEDAPQIVGIIDERPMELRIDDYRKNDMWKPVGADNNADSSLGINQNAELSAKLQNVRNYKSYIDDNESVQNNYKLANKSVRRNDKNSARRSKRDCDKSPERSQRDSTPIPRRRTNNEVTERREDDDISPSRKSRGNSDTSPVIKSRKDRDISPVRRNRKESDDISPPRRSNQYVSSPSRKFKKDRDLSPVRKNRNDQDDMSPPRKSRRESDASPPRKSTRSNDLSPIRNSKKGDDKNSIREYNRIAEISKRTSGSYRDSLRNDYDRYKSSKGTSGSYRDSLRNDYDRYKSSKGNYERNMRDGTDDENSNQRKIKLGKDVSPIRHSKDSSRQDNRTLENVRIKEERDGSSSSKSTTSIRQSRWDDGNDKNEQSALEEYRIPTTVNDRKSGLRRANELMLENEFFRQREYEIYKEKATDFISSSNAAPVVRDRKTGKIRDLQMEAEEANKKQKIKDETKAKYDKWGKGLKQVEEANERLSNDLHEMSKPLARYADDEDLEKHLKEMEREGDPMLQYLRKKKMKQDIISGKPIKPQFEGEFMPNRYGIRPGHRWDGVDRSNGYEKKWFQVMNSRRAQQEDAYKWSTEDM